MGAMTGLILALGLAGLASAQATEPADPVDPRARVSLLNPGSDIPDHVSQIVGPTAEAHGFNGTLQPRRMYRIEANPQAGFHWPYFLFMPDTVDAGSSILVEPNNDGLWGAPFETHEYWAAIRNEQLYLEFGRHLNTPMLTPVFPRPLTEDSNLYIHALSRAAMVHGDPRYARPDLQLIAMMNDAQAKLSESRLDVTEDALFWGFSAAADFATRMAVMHPDRVRAVVAGGVGGLPILPLETYQGETLTYPVGVADLSEVAGFALDAEALRTTPMLLFQGGADENDSVKEPPFDCETFRSDSYSCEQARWVNTTLGASTVERVPLVADIYADFGMSDFNSIILPGIRHTTPDPMLATMRSFYACVLAGDTGCAARVSAPTIADD
jgi:pimeloyl-ACP methyl ester carboxylesterase